MERRAFIGETYCCDDGRIEEACEDEPYDECGYMENNGDEWEYYDEDDREYFDPKDFKDEIILRWVYGKLRKEWVPGKMKDVSTINGHCYYLDICIRYRGKACIAARFFRCRF